jgi:predicted DNA-binding transcriptional regulator YafY
VRERFHLDAPGWFHRPEPVPCLEALADAVWRGRRIGIEYGRGGRAGTAGQADRTVRRDLDPLGLVLKAGVWYLIAAQHEHVRTYRVGRVAAVEVLDGEVARPAGFDLASWWEASAAEFDRSILRGTVTLRLSPLAARRLAEVTDHGAAERALAAAGPPDPDDWVEIELAVESPEVALQQLVALGDGVEVLTPLELRAAFGRVGATMAARHGRRVSARPAGRSSEDVCQGPWSGSSRTTRSAHGE